MSTTAAAAWSTLSTVTSAIASTIALEDWQASVLWILILGFVIAFILAFAVGANDVANSFGTTVGAGTLTLKQACVLASIFETLGAILLGAKVGATIRKGIIDVDIYADGETLLMVGEISAMLASGLWQLIATFLKLPVSGTHSIVGATVGFSLVARGVQGVNWAKMGLIVGSWFLSPVLAGGMAALFYYVLRKVIFQKDDPVRPGLIAMPIMYGCTIAINCFSVLFSGAPLLGFDKLMPWVDVLIAISIGLLIAALVQLIVVRKLKASISAEQHELSKVEQKASPLISNKRVAKLPVVMETISEDVTSNGGSQQNASVPSAAAIRQGRKYRMSSAGEQVTAPQTFEEAKLLRRQRAARRCKSVGTGHDTHGSVRLPPLLQLETNVLKSNAPQLPVKEIKEEIRRNFSEPTMLALTEKSDADIYEVFINRQRKLVTIQRKKSKSFSGDTTDHVFMPNAEGDGQIVRAVTDATRLEEPFEDSDEEGLVMDATADLLPPAYPRIYSSAIEEGFRRLSTSQQDIVAIKIGENEEGDKEEKKLSKDEMMEKKEGRMEIRKIFSFLQILTACFGSFAHGGNDVSNAIGPLIAIWIIYNEGNVQQKANTPLLILFYGGVGICCGLWVWGRRVIKTMGNDITNLTPSRGFVIELMSAITVLAASNSGLPVSTTHCKVGAVVAVGWVRSRDAVDWKIFRNIVLAWFVTVPISGGLSAVVFVIIRAIAGLDG